MPEKIRPQPNDLISLDSADLFNSYAYDQGWTDGLPVVEPTAERVSAMISDNKLNPLEVLGLMPPGQGVATVHAVAVNSVMAGCSSEHLPVVVACVRAALTPQFNLYGVQTTTNPVTPVIMVNGPIVERLDFNSGYNCFGPGSRSNAVVGRALRFCLLNIGYATPGERDMATQGQPGKYAFCFAENEGASPWDPHHTERGYGVESSCVTLFQGSMLVNVLDFGSNSAGDLLMNIASTMSGPNTNNFQVGRGDMLIVLSPEHASILSRDSFSKEDVKRYLANNAYRLAKDCPESLRACIAEWRSSRYKVLHADTPIKVVDDWEHVQIAVAGGSAGGQSAIIPGFGDGWSVCVEV